MAEARIVWGAMWRSNSNLDGGLRTHLINENCLPVLFRTRREARAFIEQRYGYITKRPDLRAQPHGWRLPIPVRVAVRRASTRTQDK